ncbi:MAG: biopolymer transporter ExbD [Candidatus Nealsonbacteria bacterium]|nr:biopolymer transporter ExbD [Candidatus Nealsonbacteria bacterium]
MVDDQLHDDIDELEEDPILPRRRVKNSADLDITPMIDIVFLLLIFFIVASVPDPQVEADLPHARHGKGVDKQTSVIFTVKDLGDGQTEVYLGNGKRGDLLPEAPGDQDAIIRKALAGHAIALLPADPDAQEDAIRRAVLEGNKNQGKTAVLVKAEKGVPFHVTHQVGKAVGSAGIEGMGLNFAVIEGQ